MRTGVADFAFVLIGCALLCGPALAQASPQAPPQAPVVAPTPPPAAPAAAPADPNAPATVYVYVGRTFWPGGVQAGVDGRWDVAADDGQKIHLSDDRFLEFDTSPGKHRFTRYARALVAGAPASIELTLAPGEEAYLGLNEYQDISPKTLHTGERVAFAGGLLFGIVGGVATGLAVTAAVVPTHPKPLDHPYGVWLVREPPPVEDATGPKAR